MGEVDKEARGLTENENALEARGLTENENALYIEECGGMEKIFECQNNENSKIYEKAFTIVDKYFAAEEELDDTGLAPGQDGNQFTFNAGNQTNFSF
jgi:hypothetical protein